MSLVSLAGVHVSFGGVPVLEDVSLDVHPDSRIGVVGPNGCGKTTLLRVLLGEQEPDDGSVEIRRGIRIERLRQDPDLEADRTPREFVLEGFADVLALERRLRDVEHEMGEPRDDEHLAMLLAKHGRLQHELEAQGGYEVAQRAEEALTGLGLPPEVHDRPVGQLSGGQQTRIALARVLVREPQMLVLDEPTNHLDVDATEWLEERLATWKGAFVVVSHDRWFLDRVARSIAEIERARLTTYRGGYTDYVEQREIRVRTIEKAYEKQQREIAHDEDFIRKNLAAQAVSMARGRQKKLARMERVGPPPREGKRLRIDLGEGKSGEGDVLHLDRVGHAYEEGRWLFRRASFRFERGDRVGVVGPNGGGKTTWLRICAGLLEPREGRRHEGKTVRAGVFEQDRTDLDPDKTPLESLRELDAHATDGALRSWLGRFRISGEDSLRPIRTLSGGEASRVAIACLLYAGPNVLFLDEPTNHLDVGSREALEEALNEFPGSALLVSHDRRLLDRTVTRILHVADGVVHEYRGGYTAFRAKRAEERAAARAAAEEAERRRRRERHRETARRRTGPRPPKLEEVEAAIIEREERLEAIHAEMACENVYRDAARMRALKQEEASLETELADLNARWEDLTAK